MTSAVNRGLIDLSSARLDLDGIPSVLLCSSLFPFRIPRSQWDHRLQLVAESGYRMIDLYVHWGFHEEAPGRIDLTSPERDLGHFLDLARTHGLLVMARPGPYICSETDGGGLPWWLHGDADGAPAALRTTDPAYLAAVDRWFGAVIPLLADAQVTRGGSVALVQIENELDFFDCPDPDAYMDHLARSARAHGIEVPIIACAGQGELAGATGEAAGVVPTVNLYPDDASATFDEETRHYAGVLAARDLPLLVTETNRRHRTLRREILAGARLVAPYLQTSGFDHLVLPSAGNWGDPGNLMTHDYDFGGYISPEGRRRPEYDEAIALAATLEAWGERLATAAPVPLDAVPLEGARAGGALALEGGGHIVGPAEIDGLARTVGLRSSALARAEGSAAPVAAALDPGACPFWALDVPLAPWGVEGTLAIATAELIAVEHDETGSELTLRFEGGPRSRIALVLPTSGEGEEILRQEGHGTVRSAAAGPAVRIVVGPRGESRADPEPVRETAGGSVLRLGDVLRTAGAPVPSATRRALPGAEALGLADGRVQAELELSAEATEALLLGAADLVRLELDGVDRGLHVPHGAPLSLPLPPGAQHRLRIVAETWGRANFDDARLPALRIGAGRGVGIVLEVRSAQDVTDLWEVRRLPDRRTRDELEVPPLRDLGGWSSANPGAGTTYARTVPLPGTDRLGALRLHGLTEPVHVAVDGGEEQLVMPSAPIVLLDGGGASADLAIRAPHVPGGLLERAELLEVALPVVHALRRMPEAELAEMLTRTAREAEPSRWRALPAEEQRPSGPGLRIGAGEPVLLRVAPGEGRGPGGVDGGELLEIHGADVQVTVLAGGRRVSRHVLGAPVTAGGDPHLSWIPSGWRTDPADEVLLMVEALAERGGIFEAVRRTRTAR
ncbi:beta-galactosidase [Brachybacterium sp. AOP43-C2-M15]|uniref:beta-galactosidase n=1 Tax=Brachybacterium sp. AOP43-C2-M15 TaxID=3457661 RepID=UPI004034CA40